MIDFLIHFLFDRMNEISIIFICVISIMHAVFKSVYKAYNFFTFALLKISWNVSTKLSNFYMLFIIYLCVSFVNNINIRFPC